MNMPLTISWMIKSYLTKLGRFRDKFKSVNIWFQNTPFTPFWVYQVFVFIELYVHNQKKSSAPILRKMCYRQTDWRTYRRTDKVEFIGTSGRSGAPKIYGHQENICLIGDEVFYKCDDIPK